MSTGLGWLSADGRRILAGRTLRTFAYGSLAVVLGANLDLLGPDPLAIGLVSSDAAPG